MTAAGEDIEALIARVAIGDRSAFRALYEAVSGKLFAICLRILKDRARAEDALQETFVKVWVHSGRYRPGGARPMTWLITIARNAAIDIHRGRRDEPGGDEAARTLASPGLTPEVAAIAGSETRRILACLGELPEDRRAAVRGAYLLGESYADLSRRHGVPLNTVRSWLRRSLIALRECLSR